MSKGIFELEEFKPPSGDNVLIVDGLNLAFRYKHTGDTNFRDKYLKTVQSLAKSYNSEKVIITSDMGSSTYRLELYPEYKADRREKVAQQSEEEKEEFEKFFKEFNETLEMLESYYPVLKYAGVEADDIAAYLAQYVGDCDHIWLVSSDKDWDLLVGDKVSRFSYVTRKEYTIDNFEEMHGYPLEYALDIKVLQGGKDNVSGIPGVGPKRAIQLVETYGSAFDIFDALPLPGTQVFIKNTNEFGENILRNLELIDKKTYCEVAIGSENIEKIKKALNSYDINVL